MFLEPFFRWARELASAEAASIGIIGSAAGDGHGTGLGDGDLGLAGGGGDLGGSDCTGEDEGDDEGTDGKFHWLFLLILLFS